MLTTTIARMGRNNRCYLKSRGGHDWVYLRAKKDANHGVRFCQNPGCGRRRHIKNFAATMKARERRILQ